MQNIVSIKGEVEALLQNESLTEIMNGKELNSRSRLKVLFVIDTLEYGGAEQSLLANAMRFQTIKPVVCHIYKGATLKPKFIENGIQVYSLDIQKKYGFIAAYKKLIEVLKLEQPHLIVPYLTRSEVVARLVGKFGNVPVVGTFVNDLYSATYNRHLSWKSKKIVQFFKFINKVSSKTCIGFVSNSESIKEANARHLNIPLEKIVVINRGRDSSAIKCRNIGKQVNTSHIRFINVSRLFSVKGQKLLISGFKKFLEKFPAATLSIVGEGPMRRELSEIIFNNKLERNVFLLGARDDVSTILCEYDCFIFPSLMEGFSGAIVEAMFAGLPVLASDISQNKEVITHLDTGYLFTTDSEEAITRAMLWFMDNQSIAYGYACKAYDDAIERFELNKIALQLENYLCNKIRFNN
jgi:glycosyltransferase involved in cell wall biosynthesis